jgi:CRISPR-associated endonuclease/helicase Cas3
LFVLEDVTGAGKTEAAMTLVHRLLEHGQARGVYFGLPTMATSNAMYGRVADIYRRWFDEQQVPNLVLAHGARHLNTDFAHSVVRRFAQEGFVGGCGRGHRGSGPDGGVAIQAPDPAFDWSGQQGAGGG